MIEILIDFSPVAIIGQVLIFLKMRDVEVIHSPIWAIIVALFLLLFFVWGLCAQKSLNNNFLAA